MVGERAGSVWKIYVDGVLANQNDVGTAGSISASLDDLYIGRYGGTEHCKATIDDVRVYSGALSASEIQQLYSQYNAPPPTTGLVAHWKFDEGKGSTTVDSSHNGNLGEVSGATWQSSTECIVGDSCLRFDGINDFMNGGNSPSLQISNDITVSAWMKKAPIAFEAEVCIGKYFNTPDTGWVLVYDTDGTVHFDGRDGSGIYKKSVGPVLDDNEWHFVTGQREGSVWKIYVDGTLRDANDVSYAGSINAISDNLYVGRYSPSSGYCEGTIDDVRIFNTALSDEEILQIYQESLLQ